MSFTKETDDAQQNNLEQKSLGDIKFTHREFDVISCIVNGRTSKKIIASLLDINPRTVITHTRNIMQKLQCTSWEYIPPFVEKSGNKQGLIKHFCTLMIRQKFRSVLEKIKILVMEPYHLELSFFPYMKQENIDLIKDYFNIINIKVTNKLKSEIDNNEGTQPIRLVINDEYIKTLDYGSFKDAEDLSLHIIVHLIKHKSLSSLVDEFENFRLTFTTDIKMHNFVSKKRVLKDYIFQRKLYIISPVIFLILILISIFWKADKKTDLVPLYQSEIKLPKNSALLEREIVIEEIDNRFEKANKSAIPIVCIIGMGGSGKTTLARMWNKKFSCQFPKSITWELNAETQESLQESFKNLAKYLAQTTEQQSNLNVIESLPQKEEKEKERFLFIQNILKSMKGWALIYDNVENLSDISKYLPGNLEVWGNGKVLVTTRNSHFKYADIIVHENVVLLDKLSEDECYSLFYKLRFPNEKQTLTSEQEQDIKNFLQNLPPFPLDISVAAKYILSNKVLYEDYLNALNTQEKEFYTVQKSMLQETSSYIKTRYSILTLSFKSIIEENPKFEDFLTMLIMIDSQNIPYELLESHYGKSTVTAFLIELKKHSLITEDSNTDVTDDTNTNRLKTFSIHRSTQDICNIYLMQNVGLTEKNPTVIALGETFATFLNGLVDIENYLHISHIVPHCSKILQSSLLTPSIKGIVSVALGWTYFCTGHDTLAKQFLEKGIVYLKQVDEKNNNKKVNCSESVLSHIDQQRYSGDIHIVQATSYLGIVYLRSGAFEKSKKLLEWSRPIYQLSNNDIEYTRVLTFSGYLYTLMNDYTHAKDILLSSIKLCRQNNVRQMNLARALTFFGYLNKEIGDYENATIALNESIGLYKDKLMNAWVKAHLACIENESGKYKIAEEKLLECRKVYKNQGASTHVNLIWILPTLGSVYRKIGNYTEAEKLFKDGYKIYKMHESESGENFNQSFSGVHLGKLYRKTGLYGEAQKLLEITKVEHTKMYGENNSRTLWNDVALASLFIDIHMYHEAKFLIEKCILHYEKTLLPSHYKIGKALSYLGIVFCKLGDIEKAHSLFKEALENLENHYGKNHLETTSTLRAIGDLYLLENNFEKAEEFINKSYEILKSHDHPDMHLSLEKLAAIYTKKGDKEKSKEYLNKALKIIETNFPKESAHIIRIRKSLSKLI